MSAANTPPLADAKERDLAATDLTRTYLIEAAAGTGKTTLLVQRVMNIVLQKQTPLSRVVAITFTEKAAGELKVKLRGALERALREDIAHQALFETALHELDAMPVGTIHSFCRDLIAQRPVEAGTDPGFTVADEAAARLLREEVWETWMAEELNQESCPAWPLLVHGLPVASINRELSLRTFFNTLIERREDLSRLHVVTMDARLAEQHVAELVRDSEAALRLAQHCRHEDDSLLRNMREVERWLRQADWSHAGAALQSLNSAPRLNKGHKGQKGNWPPDVLDQARAFFIDNFEARCSSLTATLIGNAAAPVVEWLKGAVQAYEQAKRERGWLDFHDLMLTAHDLLKQHAAVREEFKARYDYLLVDEFQDTDPLQAEIVFFLAEESGECAPRWPDVKLTPGKLFIVADPKQSIYRFRRADLDLYGAVRTKIEHDGCCRPIRVNFRSDPEIIREVNTIFREQMSGKEEERYEPDYVAMEPHRPAGGAQRIVLLPPPASVDLLSSAKTICQQEAACLAEYIRATVTAKEPLRADESTPICYRDFGLLYFATTHLADLEIALRARDVPYRITGGRDFAKRVEIQALLAALLAIDNPFDETAVVGALRSPFFACTDEELLQHRLDGGNFVYTTTTSRVDYLEASFAVLRELHEQRRHDSSASIVMALLEKTPGLAIYGLKPHGETRVGNLLKVLDWAQRFARDGGSFHDLTQWLARLEDLRTTEDESLPAESSDDVVQLMTFHKAKGLEFPIVMLYRLAHEFGGARDPVLFDRQTGALEFKSAAGRTSGYDNLLKDEEERERCETMRLLYVAMTRARDRLVLPLYWEKQERSAEKRWLLQFLRQQYAKDENGRLKGNGTGVVVVDTSSYNLESPLRENVMVSLEAATGEVDAGSGQDAQEAWRVKRDAAAQALQRERELLRPSDLVDVPESKAKIRGDFVAEPAAAFGRFVHRILEQVVFPQADNLNDAAAAAAEEFDISEERREEGCQLVRRLLTSDFFVKHVLPAGQWWRELNFAANVNGTLIEGVMDLVFFENERSVIVDYKTDFLSAADVEPHARMYRGQAAAYAQALERIVNIPVQDVVLCFLRPGCAVALTGENLRIP